MATFNELASREIIHGIEAIHPDHLLFIPCSTIGKVIQHFEECETVHSFPVSREEDGIGIAAGISLAGKKPLVLIQDTGIGNSLLALTAFCMAYHVPMLILVTRRGGMGEINSAVQYFSEPLPRILDDAGIQTFRLDYRVPLHEWAGVIQQAEKYSRDTHRPIIVMFNIKGGAEQ
ncbi:MAG TPA: thiamine pyrophosphate-binding protein [Bacillales bacterium]|nr:thiamine pyrophosphate-binding protein [Bacillales bacterium]